MCQQLQLLVLRNESHHETKLSFAQRRHFVTIFGYDSQSETLAKAIGGFFLPRHSIRQPTKHPSNPRTELAAKLLKTRSVSLNKTCLILRAYISTVIFFYYTILTEQQKYWGTICLAMTDITIQVSKLQA